MSCRCGGRILTCPTLYWLWVTCGHPPRHVSWRHWRQDSPVEVPHNLLSPMLHVVRALRRVWTTQSWLAFVCGCSLPSSRAWPRSARGSWLQRMPWGRASARLLSRQSLLVCPLSTPGTCAVRCTLFVFAHAPVLIRVCPLFVCPAAGLQGRFLVLVGDVLDSIQWHTEDGPPVIVLVEVRAAVCAILWTGNAGPCRLSPCVRAGPRRSFGLTAVCCVVTVLC